MSNVKPFSAINGLHGLHPPVPKAFPDVPIVGQPIAIHGLQFTATITCRCSEPHPVIIGDARRPLICPTCRTVWAVTKVTGELLTAPNQFGEILQLNVMFGRVGRAEEAPAPAAPPATDPPTDAPA